MLFLAVCFAAFRATRVVTRDALFDVWRDRFYRIFPPDDEYAHLHLRQLPDNGAWYWEKSSATRGISKFGQFVSCPWCLGFWLSGSLIWLLTIWVSIWLPVLWWFAVSAAVGLIARNLDD